MEYESHIFHVFQMKDTPDNELDDVQNMLTCWAVEEQYFNGINSASVQLVGMYHTHHESGVCCNIEGFYC
jgi:hypothetical protein